MTKIKLGHFASTDETESEYPKVEDCIDPSWDKKEKLKVLAYLRTESTRTRRYRGMSKCRVCDCNNGNTEESNHKFVWPGGFTHYIVEHNVKPSQKFIDHVLKQPSAPKYYRGKRPYRL